MLQRPQLHVRLTVLSQLVDLGGEVKDDLRGEADDHVPEFLGTDIHLMEVDVAAAACVAKAGQHPGRQIVDDQHLGALVDQPIDEVGSDEACAAGHYGLGDRHQIFTGKDSAKNSMTRSLVSSAATGS
ncbi:MAG: hypothetical protein IIA44_01140 [Acidobacteria bacterium]|nr:hypothetical protein [Acidobacteriota bacterium]